MLAFHISLATKYGSWLNMPFGSDVVNCGCVQLDEPVGGGAVVLPDGDGEADAEGWLLGDAEWLADVLGLGECEARDAGFGMTATCGAAARTGIRVADALLAPSCPAVVPPVAAAAVSRRGVVPCPEPRKLTAASPPPANTAKAVTPMTTPRDSGMPRNRGLPGPGAIPALGLLVIWLTQPPITAVFGEL